MAETQIMLIELVKKRIYVNDCELNRLKVTIGATIMM